MTAVYFNELTLTDSPDQNRLLLSQFRKVWAGFASEMRGQDNRVYSEGDAIRRLAEAVCLQHDPELMQFFSTVINRTFSTSDKSWPEDVRDHFLGSEFTINLRPTERPECPTMGWAHLNGSITIGLESSNIWRQLEHRIIETPLEGEERRHDVLCLTTERHLADSKLKSWFISQRDFCEVNLPEKCHQDPRSKRIHYRDDHGREILEAFAQKLVRNEYVVEVVNSLPWHPGCDHFILEPSRADGIVNVCLHWHDEGYGLAVQTTARGIPQTMKVAELLCDEYDQGS